jgi:transcriptional regulator
MYINPAFKTDADSAWAFVRARGFGTVVAVDAGSPVGAHVPLLVASRDGTPTLEFHVARANPLHRVIAASPQVLVVVAGPDAYISPDWYVSSDQVPTWNYMAAHIRGQATLIGPGEAHAHVEALSLAFEERLRPKKPWSTSKMSARKLEAMLAAIVPIRVVVESIECSFKLSQNKSEADRLETARMLDWRGGAGERGVAAAMRRLQRPGKGGA